RKRPRRSRRKPLNRTMSSVAGATIPPPRTRPSRSFFTTIYNFLASSHSELARDRAVIARWAKFGTAIDFWPDRQGDTPRAPRRALSQYTRTRRSRHADHSEDCSKGLGSSPSFRFHDLEPRRYRPSSAALFKCYV